ncbi:MAG: hypothetical protein K8I03_12290 [Ignavibacteria bacterium]|nr:hypothetical protein [Ignavibacteria bacterium]
MKISLFLIFAIFFGCSKQEKTASQNADSVKNAGSTTAGDVKQTDQTTSQPVKVKEYKKGEPIELYDLIYMLLPNEGETTEVFAWETGNDIKPIKWEKDKHCWDGKCSKNGTAKVIIDGKNTQADGDWYISLNGKENGPGFNWFSIGFGFDSHGIGGGDVDCEESLKLDYFFAAKNVTSILLENHKCSAGSGWAVYEVSFPGKRIFWIKIMIDSGSKIGDLSLVCFFNKEDLKMGF